MSLKNWLLLLLTASTFALSLPFNKLLVQSLPPVSLSAARTLIALPFIMMISVFFGAGFPKTLTDWRASLVGAVFLIAIPFFTIAYGQQFIPSGLGGILYAAMPLISALLAAWAIAGERLTGRKLIGCLVGLGGVAIIVGLSVLRGASDHMAGTLVTLLAPLAYAIGNVLLRLRPASHPLVLTSGMFLIGGVFLTIAMLTVEGMPATSVRSGTILPLAGLAIAGTAVPAFLNYVMVQRVGPTNAALVMFVMPIFAVVYGAAFFAEALPVSIFFGMAMIITGCGLIAGRWATLKSR